MPLPPVAGGRLGWGRLESLRKRSKDAPTDAQDVRMVRSTGMYESSLALPRYRKGGDQREGFLNV